MDHAELKQFIKQVIDEEFGPKPVPMAKRWSGGKIVLQPSNDTQSKEVPIDIFFKKITGIRESLRVLEQKINNCEALSAEERINFQAYVTKCYGGLTTFNILFRDDKDKFIGSGSGGGSGDGVSPSTEDDELSKLSIGELRRRRGVSEHGRE
jgi:hypothetical protein